MAVNSIKVFRRHTLKQDNSGERIYPPKGSDTYSSDNQYFLPLLQFSLTSSKGYVWKYNSSSTSNMSASSQTYFTLDLGAYDEKGSITLKDALSESSYWSFDIIETRSGFVSPSYMTWQDGGKSYLVSDSPSSTYSISNKDIPSNAIIDMTFQQKTYKQSFNANGGTGGPSSATKYYFQPFEFPSTFPTKTNSTFAGWKLSGGSTVYSPGDKLDDWKTLNGVSYIYYAQWESTTIPVESISITGNGKLALSVGDIQYLTATITPDTASNQGRSWNSSDSNVVTISSSGQVKAINNGIATITVTSAENTNIYDTCTIYVGGYLTDIELFIDKDSSNPFHINNSVTVHISPTSIGDGYNRDITWSITSGSGTLTIPNNNSDLTRIVTMGKTGSITIKAYDNVFGKYDTIELTSYVNVKYYRNDRYSEKINGVEQPYETSKSNNDILNGDDIEVLEYGQEFIKWNTQKSGNGSTILSLGTGYTTDLNLYAIWQQNTGIKIYTSHTPKGESKPVSIVTGVTLSNNSNHSFTCSLSGSSGLKSIYISNQEQIQIFQEDRTAGQKWKIVPSYSTSDYSILPDTEGYRIHWFKDSNSGNIITKQKEITDLTKDSFILYNYANNLSSIAIDMNFKRGQLQTFYAFVDKDNNIYMFTDGTKWYGFK